MERAPVRDDDKSALLDILVWLFLVTGVLAVIAQAVTKLVIRRRLGWEDFWILLSLAFAIGESVCVGIQVTNGLGKHVDTLSTFQQETVFKAQYAGNMLFMVCLCLTKLSLLVFIKTLALLKSYRYAVYGLAIFIIVWTILSVLVTAFQCQLPQPWNSTNGRCINQKAFWNFYGTMNIVTDLGPVIIMILVASRIQTSMGRKITVAGVFSSRLSVIGAVLGQLYFMNRATPTTDPTFDLWPSWVCMQLVQALAIITACVPYLKPFMDSLESGGFRADDQRRRGTNGYGYDASNSYNKYGVKPPSMGKGGPSRIHDNRSHIIASDSQRCRRRSSLYELGVIDANKMETGHGTKVAGGPGSDWDDDDDNDIDGNSQSSQSRIIKETRSFTVDVEMRT